MRRPASTTWRPEIRRPGQYRRKSATIFPWMRTRLGGNSHVHKCHWRAQARSTHPACGSASAWPPRRRSAQRRCRLFPPRRTFFITAISPSRIPASIMLSPRTSNAKCSPLERTSGGMLITWLLVWIASIGVPAAIRPITGTATGRPPSSSDEVRTRPRFPSMTLGVNPRERPAPTPWATDSGELDYLNCPSTIGKAPDEAAFLECRDQAMNSRFRARESSASFISSKEGGTPASFRRS